MATANSNKVESLKDDVSGIVRHSYDIEALLHGALSLLEGYHGPDTEGELFHARCLIEAAQQKTAHIYEDFDTKEVSERIKALEAAEVCHA